MLSHDRGRQKSNEFRVDILFLTDDMNCSENMPAVGLRPELTPPLLLGDEFAEAIAAEGEAVGGT